MPTATPRSRPDREPPYQDPVEAALIRWGRRLAGAWGRFVTRPVRAVIEAVAATPATPLLMLAFAWAWEHMTPGERRFYAVLCLITAGHLWGARR